MKAVHLVAGAGGMYCGSCLHGNTLAAALRQVIHHPELAADHGRRAQRAVHERYHAELMARRTMELYKKVGVT